MKYWYNLEYVPELKKKLWHVWETGITQSICIDAFDDESLAKSYTDFLNKC